MSPPTENQDRFSRRYWLRLIMFTAGVSIAAGLFLLTYFIWLQLEAFITPRRNTTMGSPAELGRPFEAIVLTTQDGLKIAGWYIVGTRPQAMVLVHGIDANRQAVLPEAAVLADAGYHLNLL